jgi:hypothetical protein
MRRNRIRKLVLTTETLRVLGDPQMKDIVGLGAKAGTNPDDDTCYWGCSFSCPDGGCRDIG